MNEEIFKNLADMLDNNTISDNLKNNMHNFVPNNSDNDNSSDNNKNTNGFDFSNIDMGTIMKIKKVMESMNSKKNDSRSNLLMSLKPYLKPSRKEKLDQYMNLLNISSVFEAFNSMGGEKK